jgi:hypothetical protein
MIDQNTYTLEARERCTHKALLTRLSDVAPLDDLATLAAENAYRRGYFQGYAAAEQARSSGHAPDKVRRFLYDRLFSWRYCRHNGKFLQPPALDD